LTAGLNPWAKILEGAAGIKTPISVTVIAIVALVVILKSAGRTPGRQLSKLLNLTLVLVVIVGLVPYIASWSLDYQNGRRKGVYRISVTVLSSEGLPRQNVHVRSNLDAVPKTVGEGGWELDVPAGARTAKGQLEIYARDEDTGATGEQSVVLGEDENLSVTIRLTEPNSLVRGVVTDASGSALGAVKTMVVGYSEEAVLTDVNGGFVLPSHAAEGTRVKIHFEKQGYTSFEDYFTAGGRPTSTELKPNRR
jgi:hypothetical protein